MRGVVSKCYSFEDQLSLEINQTCTENDTVDLDCAKLHHPFDKP